MKLSEALIAWNPNSDEVKVGPLIRRDEPDWAYPYDITAGAAYVAVREMTGVDAKRHVMSTFIGAVVRDGVDVQAAHREFMRIEEYRKAIPEDLETGDPFAMDGPIAKGF